MKTSLLHQLCVPRCDLAYIMSSTGAKGLIYSHHLSRLSTPEMHIAHLQALSTLYTCPLRSLGSSLVSDSADHAANCWQPPTEDRNQTQK